MEIIARSPAMLSFRVADTSQVGEVRRAAGSLANQAGFDETRAGQVMVVATELAKNLAIHASDGEVLLRTLSCGGVLGVELLAVDRGPGMADVSRHRRDGFSTAGTAGMGLGAIERMSDLCEVHSLHGIGTASVVRIWEAQPKGTVAKQCQAGLVAVPKRGERVSGDTCAAITVDGRTVVMVADGLGHGPQASTASMAALAVLEGNASLGPMDLIRQMHAALRGTRGAAVAVAEVNWQRQEVRFCGIGNISASVNDGVKAHNLMSHNGTIGVALGKVQEFTYPFTTDSVLILNSDGLKTHWNLDRYPGLLTRDVSVIAGIVYRDNRRDRDDVTVLVLRDRPNQGSSP